MNTSLTIRILEMMDRPGGACFADYGAKNVKEKRIIRRGISHAQKLGWAISIKGGRHKLTDTGKEKLIAELSKAAAELDELVDAMEAPTHLWMDGNIYELIKDGLIESKKGEK